MPLDINKPNFVRDQSFKISDATIGIIGHGYVGKAVEAFFRGACNVLVNDKTKPELNSLLDVVQKSELVFVCVPTPMRRDGSCYTGIVEEVLADVKRTSEELGRKLDTFIVVIKSTVRPGFLEEMQDKFFGMRLLFSPEFLTEKNSINDFKKSNRFVFGGDEDDALVACKYFHDVNPKRVQDDRVLLVQCEPTVAEMAKLYTNGILMTKVLFSNEIYQMCLKLGIEYEEVREIACLDPRIGPSHTIVPGHDGKMGAGGSCFPKDINNLRTTANMLGLPERLFTAVIERNNELRPEQDWNDLKDRAVTDK